MGLLKSCCLWQCSWLWCVLALVCNTGCDATVVVPLNVPVEEVFVFSDSYVDQDNNNRLLITLAKANFPPCGKDFPGGYPTGRFCNGKTPLDLIGKPFHAHHSSTSHINYLTTDQSVIHIDHVISNYWFPYLEKLAAEALCVSELIPAYLDSNLTVKDLTKSVSFASGGSGYDPKTAQLLVCIDLLQAQYATICDPRMYV